MFCRRLAMLTTHTHITTSGGTSVVLSTNHHHNMQHDNYLTAWCIDGWYDTNDNVFQTEEGDE
jgi:hypothetical protein